MSAQILIPHIEHVRVPNDKVIIHKEECVLSFVSIDSPDGIFVSLKSFLGFSKNFVRMYHSKSGDKIYLNIIRIGVEYTYKIVILPEFIEFCIDDDDLPEKFVLAIAAIVAAPGTPCESRLIRFNEGIISKDGSSALTGPGFTGLTNFANNCFMNSVVQVLSSIPLFVNFFTFPPESEDLFLNARLNSNSDLSTQFIKIFSALHSGQYTSVAPRMLKKAIRFKEDDDDDRQHDCHEFFLHLMNQIGQFPSGTCGSSASQCFKFKVEERLRCGTSQKVRYTHRTDFVLTLPIVGVPMLNRTEYEEFMNTKALIEADGSLMEDKQTIRPVINLSDCLKVFAEESRIDEYFSPVTKTITYATNRIRLETFPEILVLHMKMFVPDKNGRSVKLNTELLVPEVLDLSILTAKGKQGDEDLIQDDKVEEIVVNEDYVFNFFNMGFKDHHSRFALRNCNNNQLRAMEFILENAGWIDDLIRIAEDKEAAADKAKTKEQEINSELSAEESMLLNMGVEPKQARLALEMNNNNIEAALVWIETNRSTGRKLHYKLDAEVEDKKREGMLTTATVPLPQNETGQNRYKLMAMVCHIGPTSQCGHYISYIRKQIPENMIRSEVVVTGSRAKSPSSVPPTASGSPNPNTSNTNPEKQSYHWVKFNDSKVSICENPPTKFAYLYFYKRMQDDEQQ